MTHKSSIVNPPSESSEQMKNNSRKQSETSLPPDFKRSSKGDNKNSRLAFNTQSESFCERKENIAFLADKNKNNWIIDSGSTSHLCNNKELFCELNFHNENNVVIANGLSLKAYGSGKIPLQTKISNEEIKHVTLKDVLYVPDIETNLISVRKACISGCTVIFEKNNCKFMYEGETYLKGILKNNLYEVATVDSDLANTTQISSNCKNKNCIAIWHKRLGHRNYDAIKQLISQQLANGIQINMCKHDITCECCIKGKLTDMPYPKTAMFTANKCLELVHSTIGGVNIFLL